VPESLGHDLRVVPQSRADRRVSGELLDRLLLVGTIGQGTYSERCEKLTNEIAVTRSELHDMDLQELDVEAVLEFAESLVRNARKMREQASLEERQQPHKAPFP